MTFNTLSGTYSHILSGTHLCVKSPTLSGTLLENPTLSGTEMCQKETLPVLVYAYCSQLESADTHTHTDGADFIPSTTDAEGKNDT